MAKHSKLTAGVLPKSLTAVSVIMAGGQGTRFWPLSRASRPKQFLSLGSGESLLQDTATRLVSLTSADGVLVVTGTAYTEHVQTQLPRAAILSEPAPRNTAPCVGMAALKVLREVGDVPMLCLPADHVISNTEALLETYHKGIEIALKQDALVTVGVKPTAPETGYGYIQREAVGNGEAFKVKRFVEKPSLEKAQEFLTSGDYYWNSGMFIWRPSVLLKAIEQHLPKLRTELEELNKVFGTTDEWEQACRIFERITPVSIDVGVMEKAKNVVMLPGDSFGWSDVGSWTAWADYVAENGGAEAGNILKGDVILEGCSGCAVVGGKRLIAGIGLENIVVVDTPDALLVVHRDHAQDVKKIVDLLKAKGRTELL